MLSDEEELERIREVESEFKDSTVYKSLDIVPFDDEAKLNFHKYMKKLAQDLLGDKYDLDKEKLVFLLSDDLKPNAAFVHTDTASYIYMTAPLLELFKNKDQLAFILGHELGHFEKYKEEGNHINNKAEEEYADLSAVTRMVEAGLNIEEAYQFSQELFSNRSATLKALIDEHMLDANRVTLMGDMVMSQRKDLLESGVDAEDIVGGVKHDIDPDILSLIHDRPYNRTLKDYFFSDEFQNLSDDEKVIEFFKKVEESLILRNDNSYHSRFDDSPPSKVYDIDEPNKTILRDIANIVFAHGNPNIDGQIIASTIESVFKEKDPQLIESKADVLSALLQTQWRVSDAMGDSKLQDLIKKEFSGFRESSGPDTDLFIRKLQCLKTLVSEHICHQYFSHLWFGLDNDQSDVGKNFSEDVLSHPGLPHAVSDSLGNDMKKLENGSTIFKTDRGIHVVDKDGIIELFSDNVSTFRAQFIAKQINDTIRILNDIRMGKDVDYNSKLTTLLTAWQICSPELFSNESGKRILYPEHINVMRLEDFNWDTLNPVPIEENSIKKYLTPEALSFYEEKDKYPHLPDSSYTSFIKEEMLKLLDDREQGPNVASHLMYYIQPDYRRYTREGGYTIHRHIERYEDFVKAHPDLMGYETIKQIEDARLKKYFDTYHTLEGFKPLFRDFMGNDDRSQEGGSIEMGIATSYRIFDQQEGFDLQYSPDLNTVSGLGSTVALGGYEYYMAVKEKFKQDVRKVSHWDPDNEDECVQNFHEALRGLGSTSILGRTSTPSLYQYVALDFYEKSSIKNKIQWMSKALGLTVADGEDSNVLREFKQKCGVVFKKDFENPEVSIKDKLRLFTALANENLFDEKYENYFEILTGKDGRGGLLKEIEDYSGDKASLYLILIASGHRVPDPEIRGKLIQNACKHWIKEHHQYNDITARQEERDIFITDIKGLKRDYVDKMPYDDAHAFLKTIAELSLSQEQLSRAIAPEKTSIDTQDKKTIAVAYGLDAFHTLLQEGIISSEELQAFFLGGSSWEEVSQHCSKLKQSLTDNIKHRKSFIRNIGDLSASFGFDGTRLDGQDPFPVINLIDNRLSPQYMMQIKKEFDAAPLVIKSVVMQMIMQNDDWRTQFMTVASKLFDDTNELGYRGKSFLYNYIDSREDSEKSFYLAAIYTAAQNKSVMADDPNSPYTPEQRSLASGVRLFLENSGPAGVKMAQAISSYSGVPDFMRDEMQKAKSQANPPARWEVFDWLEQSGEMDLLKQGKLGKLLGSASFFTTFDLEDESQNGKVVKILRGGSKALADNEFEIYQEMLDKMSGEFPELTSFRRLIDNAASMVDVETDLSIGEKQLHDAQKLYPEHITVDKTEFNFQVMDWNTRGETWVVMDKAKGKNFKELEHPYKKSAAKAVFITELSNMLSGQRFDSDRHAGQYKFDEKSNTIGIFDTGSISIVEPTLKDKEVLGKVLANTFLALQSGTKTDVGTILSEEIDKGVTRYYAEELSQGKPIPPYLSEFQRGLLALNDFYSEIPSGELADCFAQALNSGKNKLDPRIYKGFETALKGDKSIGLVSYLKQKLVTPEQVVNVLNSGDEITPEAKAAQQIGRIITEKVIKTGNGYDALMETLDKLKQEKLSLGVLDTECGRIQFGKGAMKEVISRLKPSNNSPEERQEIGSILYEVIKKGTLCQKLNQPFTISSLFDKQLEQRPEARGYTRTVQKVLGLVMENDTSLEDFKKAVLLGRLVDPEVRKGYSQALQESPDTGFVRKTLEKINPINFVPPQSVRKIARVVLKKFAPQCFEMINSFRRQKKTKVNPNISGRQDY